MYYDIGAGFYSDGAIGSANKEVLILETNYMKYESLIQYSEIYGVVLTDEDVVEKLKEFDCKKIMAILSKLNSLLLSSLKGDSSATFVYQQIKLLHMGKIMNDNGNWILHQNRNAIYGPQTVYLLMKKAITYSEIRNKPITSITVDELTEVLDLLMATNDLLPQGEVVGHETEYIYLSSYHNTHKNILSEFSRAYYIFNSMLKENENTEDFVADYESQNGYDLESFFFVVFNTLIFNLPDNSISEFLNSNLVFNRDFDAKGLNNSYLSVINNISTPLEKLKRLTRKALLNPWDFELFYRFPILQVEDSMISLSPTFLTYNMWEGLYWSIRFMYKRDDPRGEKYLTEFGRPFEEYVQEITENSCTKSHGVAVFQQEFKYSIGKKEHRSSDAYIKIGDSLMIIEAKAKSPHSDTLKGVNLKTILDEVKELLIEPVHQVDVRINEIYSKEIHSISDPVVNYFNDVNNIFVVIVSMEKVQPVGSLLKYADCFLTTDEEYKIINEKIVSYYNINIEDFEAICNLIEEIPTELPDVLLDWFNESRTDDNVIIPLPNYLISKNYSYKSPSELEEKFKQITHDVYLRTFGKEIEY